MFEQPSQQSQPEMCIMFVPHVYNGMCVHFLFTELHVFSGPEVSDQSVHSHTAGPHHSLPCTGGSGKKKKMCTHIHKQTGTDTSYLTDRY